MVSFIYICTSLCCRIVRILTTRFLQRMLSYIVTRLSARTILLYQFSNQRLIKLLCLRLYYLFFNQLIIIIGADEKRKWFNGLQFTLGFL